MAILTLLTDFAVADTYVGQMKGVILGIAPSASLVDLTHAVPPQDVRAGAFLLWTAVGAFPAGTVHLGVVDPGVGSSRRAIALATRREHYLVGPDNGLLLPAAERLGGITAAVQLLTPDRASSTFHGRDIFAPAAAHLAGGAPLTDLGPAATDLVQLSLPSPEREAGEVLHVDTYGNLITNFLAEAAVDANAVELDGRVVPLKKFYAEAAPGELLALVGSAGLIEVSLRDGSAAQRTGAGRGASVRLVRRRQPRRG